MGDMLKWVIAIAALLAILAAVGLSIGRSRGRELRAFALEHGGTFDPGSLMEGAPLPEAAPFDAPIVVSSEGDAGDDPPEPKADITYRNVIRIPGDGASYVVALRRYGREDTNGQWKTTSYLVCFVTLAPSDLAQVDVFSAPVSDWALKGMGASKPVKLELSAPAPGFAEEFEVRTVAGAAKPTPAALDRLLDRTVQAELAAQRNVLAGLQVRGNVVRLQAVGTPGNEAHRELYELARKLAKTWAAKSR